MSAMAVAQGWSRAGVSMSRPPPESPGTRGQSLSLTLDLTRADGSRHPAIVRVAHVGSQLEVTLLDRSTFAPVATILVPFDQAQKLAEAVMEAVREIEDGELLHAPLDPEE